MPITNVTLNALPYNDLSVTVILVFGEILLYLILWYKKAYGLKLYICSNEPEICDFLTNDLRGNGMSILKCDQCKDGYLIVKQGKNSPFLGCTNYTADGKGCNRMMTYKEFGNISKESK